jgi:hypothetical protein
LFSILIEYLTIAPAAGSSPEAVILISRPTGAPDGVKVTVAVGVEVYEGVDTSVLVFVDENVGTGVLVAVTVAVYVDVGLPVAVKISMV